MSVSNQDYDERSFQEIVDSGDFVPAYDGTEESDCGGYQYNGVCPCCGGYVRTIGGNYDNDPMWDECDTCGWRGDIEYD